MTERHISDSQIFDRDPETWDTTNREEAKARIRVIVERNRALRARIATAAQERVLESRNGH